MIPARRSQAIAKAKARRSRVFWLARLAFREFEKAETPAAQEKAFAYCRAVTEADDALERLGVARG